jgi:hypothetical protein
MVQAMKYRIDIPSRERAKWLMSTSTNTLAWTHELKPGFYVRDDDSQMRDYERMAAKYNTKLKVYDATGIRGAGQTFDMLIDKAIEDGLDKLIMLDDDLSFVMHNPDLHGSPMFVKCTPDRLKVLCEHLAGITCDQVPFASFTPIMKRTQPNLINYATPIMMCYAFHLPFFKAHPEFRFWQNWDVDARCDHNLTLRLLTSGYLTAFLASCFIPNNVNNPGGASVYRTLEVENISVKWLVDNYPGLIKTYKKRGWVNDPYVLRDAPIISWKKAFNHAAFKKNFGMRPIDFVSKHLRDYEQVYSDFIKELRA